MVVLTKTVLTNLQFKRPINMTHSPIRLFTLFLSLTASGAFAEPKVITTSNEFIELVTDNNLTRPFITLTVSSDGEIHGKGAFSKITGAWLWEDGYFCRSLCQRRTKFTSTAGEKVHQLRCAKFVHRCCQTNLTVSRLIPIFGK